MNRATRTGLVFQIRNPQFEIPNSLLFHRRNLRPDSLPAPYLDGLESPADGCNIIRGLIVRGYDDVAIRKIAGQNALDFFRRTIS